MKEFAIVIGVLALVIVGGLAFILSGAGTVQAMQVDLTSSPFPLTIAGLSTLVIQLNNPDGSPVNDASIRVVARMDMIEHRDMMPELDRPAVLVGDGTYESQMYLSMAGPWIFTVNAELANGTTIEEPYAIYVYAVGQPVPNTNVSTSYRSVNEAALAAADTDRELRILIPLGSAMQILQQEGDELIPSEIRLSLDGRNTLVIQNDDIIDHQVGPYFVRAGETIRQEFTRAATFVGTCTARHDGTINIIVE